MMMSTFYVFAITLVTILGMVVSFQLKGDRFVASTVVRMMADPTTPLVTKAGKRIEAKPGSSMLAACKSLGLKVKTDCKKGNCGICTVTVAGTKIRSCIGKLGRISSTYCSFSSSIPHL